MTLLLLPLMVVVRCLVVFVLWKNESNSQRFIHWIMRTLYSHWYKHPNTCPVWLCSSTRSYLLFSSRPALAKLKSKFLKQRIELFLRENVSLHDWYYRIMNSCVLHWHLSLLQIRIRRVWTGSDNCECVPNAFVPIEKAVQVIHE